MFAVSSQLEVPAEDEVLTCLCKLEDGLKVTPAEAADAICQYRAFQAELGRLQSELARPSRTPRLTSSLYQQEKSFKDRTEKIIAAKEQEVVQLRQELTATTLRLHAIKGSQVSEADDRIRELVDNRKPVQLAEEYRTIFEKEWLHAYEELDVSLDEARILIYLGKVAWMAYNFAQDLAKQQLAELMKREMEIIRVMSKPCYEEKERRKPMVSHGILPRKFERDETLQLLKKYRLCLAETSVPGVKQLFYNLMTRSPPGHGLILTDGVKSYIRKLAELTYMMCVQEPPMHLEWVRFGDAFDSSKFKPYSGDGDNIVGTVWPAVLRHRDGPVLARGVVDVMYGKVPPRQRYSLQNNYSYQNNYKISPRTIKTNAGARLGPRTVKLSPRTVKISPRTVRIE